jgi:hypothetical protein
VIRVPTEFRHKGDKEVRLPTIGGRTLIAFQGTAVRKKSGMGGTHSALALGGVYLIGVRTLVRIPLINRVDTVNFAGGIVVLV